MNYFNYEKGFAAKSLRLPFDLTVSINTFLQDAALEIEKDTQAEGKERINLVHANRFMQFFKSQKADFEAFGQFLGDYKGTYSYVMSHLYAVAHCVFMFHCKMPNKHRLIELTAHYDWVLYDLEDSEICQFVISNFKQYSQMPEKFPDMDGTPKSITELMYAKLHKLDTQKPFDLTSAQSALLTMLYHFLQPDGMGV
ncbi:MAG: hypothetical protein J5896_00200 [Alphaproteobacteria bacterium]|nr:hypothetical protein [Alphaproteobacteria bacterium]